MSLVWCVATVGQFAFHIIPPTLFWPSSWMVIVEVIWVSLTFLALLGVAMNELRVAFRARHAVDQGSAADSNT
jgi:hypothetical protein